MIKRLQRAVGLVLVLLLASTAGLYAFANLDVIGRALQSWLAPPVRAAEAASRAEANSQGETPNEAEGPTAPVDPVPGLQDARQVAQQADRADALPPFILADMLALVPQESTQAVYILAHGNQANLWLCVRQDDQWYNAMGPVYCRTGAGGLRWDLAAETAVTPMGWTSPGALYIPEALETSHASEALQAPETAWPAVRLDADARWATGPSSGSYNTLSTLADDPDGLDLSALGGLCLDLGHNPECVSGRGSGIFIYASDDLTGPTQGGIALSAAHMARLLELLDPEAAPMVGIFPAIAAGWQVDTGVPDSFVPISSAVPGARVEARYATDNNFMGRPLDGYQSLDIYVRAEMAAGLQKAQASLEAQGLGLLIYDGYRPDRAVRDIFDWLESDLPGNKDQFYPGLQKADLPGIYLDQNSPHRTGLAVDLTVCDLATGQPLDMGTGFDFFAPASWAASRDITEAQRANRTLLQKIMRAAGFSVYSREWWHFNYTGYAPQKLAYDFVIPQ